jgi:UDP-glucose 4-epimerase
MTSHDEATQDPAPVRAWVVGAGGLLGGALSRNLTGAGQSLFETDPITWDQPALARQQLAAAARAFTESVRGAATWRIAWCAGAGVTGSTDADLADELAALQAVLDSVGDQISLGTMDPTAGALFVASSAGGVYAGSDGPPFTEDTQPRPTSAYGRAKLAGEQRARDFAEATGVPTLIGRITNLYGPGQNLAKPQGLISHLCATQLSREAISIYVSLDTIRDYLFVDDCADMVRLALDGAGEFTAAWRAAGGGPSVLKILGSQQGVTIGTLLGEFRRVFKRSPLVVQGTSETAVFQSDDLRVCSIVWPELDHRAMTSLPAGLAATAEDLFRSVRVAG